ncbi:cellulose synthase-like protein H1 isoform X2 [Macadamia integrifolia]|uniref:cellulose synthase-like protein H1 isoform X2 n=1 Tax=Macadamia integrifolia TaxID=60698 RepID=UPI001C529D7B|nr:cellulose synthase-like protein H1 isoform X2 [Macadamia integrifolia]
MADTILLPLQEGIPRKRTLKRAVELTIFFLLLSLLSYRLVSLNINNSMAWQLAFLFESFFTFYWVLTMNVKWNPFHYRTYPQRLLNRGVELPPVDLFVTTADSILEPPIITVNTVLSLLALDYPPHKLACYVSDDGASPITFYSLMEASKFAKLWVPFCKKYDVQVRAPFMYFFGDGEEEPKAATDVLLSPEFGQEWREIKNGYGQLCQRIGEAIQKGVPCELIGEFAAFSGIERGNHPSIVKVIWENKENISEGIPHLIYLSREKRPKHPHHFKAGAMNVLTRVSGVMTNSPFMLNVDCDMFANNPQLVLHSMCLLLGFDKESASGFVQYPQMFYGGLKDDPFGNQYIVAAEYIIRGFLGLQGPLYCGTGCFHRRKVIYGLPADEADNKGNNHSIVNESLQTKFGDSKEFAKSAAQILYGTNNSINRPLNLSSCIDAAIHVAGSAYEYKTDWGTKAGLVYGSTTEDLLTGIRIHARGWRSVYSDLDSPAFLGCAPTGGPVIMIQMTRWVTGFLEILFSSRSPLLATITAKLRFRQCLAYFYLLLWGPRSLPEFFYALLPAYSIFTNTHFLPTVSEPAIFIPSALFIIYKLYTLSEYIQCRLSIRTWWNNVRMSWITTTTACLFGCLSFFPKLVGLSENIFEVTPKDNQVTSIQGSDADADHGRFTFNDSPIFMPPTILLFVNLTALFMAIVDGSWLGIGEIICCAWMVLTFLPFLKGLFRTGIYGIPWSTTWKSAALALLFLHFSRHWASKG